MQIHQKRQPSIRLVPLMSLIALVCTISGCSASERTDGGPSSLARIPIPGEEAPRRGDEIVAAGRMFHTGAPVVLWTDPGGYDAYRVHRRFVRPSDVSEVHELDGNPRFGVRRAPGDEALLPARRSGDWTLEELRGIVDQFVLHYDVCGTSRTCFRVLQDGRGLSVHFMLDVDGTIYQTLDLKERAWHATKANDRSIGIEIANIGAYSVDDPSTLDEWYATMRDGRVVMTLPDRFGDGGIRTPGFVTTPDRSDRIRGQINGNDILMHDFTPEQYDSLIKLTAALHAVFPQIQLDAPRTETGRVSTDVMSDDDFQSFAGVLGHFHVQGNKIDPGSAMQWERVLEGARALTEQREGLNR